MSENLRKFIIENRMTGKIFTDVEIPLKHWETVLGRVRV